MTHARRFVLTLPFILCAAAGIPGCGGGMAADDGGPDADDGGPDASADGAVPLSPTDQAFLAEFCAAVVPCCTTNGVTADVAVCKQSLAKLAWTRDAEVRAACLDELRQRAASGACMPDPGDLADPCTRIFDEPSGLRAPGETCTTAKDCAGSPGTVTNCFGTCITYVLGAVGDYPCLGNVGTTGLINDIPWTANSTVAQSHGFLCQLRDGLYCDWNENVCKALVPGGGACTATQICESSSCGGSTAGVCDPLPGVGDACVLNCKGDTYCDGSVCMPKLAAGAACLSSDQCSADCKGSNGCSGTCATAGVCSPLTVVQSLVLSVWCGLTPVRD
jgi:hypothetical protein